MTKRKQDFRIFCKFMKKEELKYHIDISIQTVYFVEAPLAAITALRLLGYDVQALHNGSSQALSGWMGTIVGQPFSGLSRDVQLDSSQGFSWATQGHSQSCP